jgi:hypothetical protein
MPAAAAEWLADTLPDGRLSVFGTAATRPSCPARPTAPR